MAAPRPTDNEFGSAVNLSYTLNTGSVSVGEVVNGLTVVRLGQGSAHGFEAVELKDAEGATIVAFEGTVPIGSGSFSSGTIGADAQLTQGISPAAFDDDDTFFGLVQKDANGAPIYTTGHSLGGTLAEYSAKQLTQAGDFGGGVTWAATGLPGNNSLGGPSSLVDFVDRNDAVANYSSDGPLAGLVAALHAPNGALMYHYGTVSYVDSDTDLVSEINDLGTVMGSGVPDPSGSRAEPWPCLPSSPP